MSVAKTFFLSSNSSILPRGCFNKEFLKVFVRRYENSGSSSASFYDNTVARYVSQPVEVLSLLQMLHYGRMAWTDPDKFVPKSARFVQREIPKRLARRLLDLQLLPHIVVTNPHIRTVYECYYNSFNALRAVPPVRNMEEAAAFNTLLRQHLDQHAPMLDRLAAGLREVRRKEVVGRALALDAFFDAMLRSRVSRRIICEQHLHLGDRRPGYVGVIAEALSVADAVEFAAHKTRQACTEAYGTSPEVVITGDKAATLPYIPEHIDYMLYEVLKNAARAVVEHHTVHHARDNGGRNGVTSSTSPWSLPPIVVRICASRHTPDLTIRVADQGGGIPRAIQAKVWGYGFSTVGEPPDVNSTPSHSSPKQHLQSHPSPPPGPLSSRRRTGYAAASSPYSHWMSYSPTDTATGPWAARHTADPPADAHTPTADADYDPHDNDWDTWHAAASAAETAAVAADRSPGSWGQGRGRQGGTGGGRQASPPQSGFGGEDGGVMGLLSGAAGNQQPLMAGLGFGLPLSRLYARYWGGDMGLAVLPGYGTDAYLTLRALPMSGEGEWREAVGVGEALAVRHSATR